MNFKYLLLLFVAGLTFAACGDDDDEDARTPEELLVGSWITSQITDLDTGELRAVTSDDCEVDDVIEFQADGTYISDFNDDTTCDGDADETPTTGTYTVADNTVVITAGGFPLPAQFEVTESTLRLTSEFFGETEVQVYSRQ